jgi:hypothetical protein
MRQMPMLQSTGKSDGIIERKGSADSHEFNQKMVQSIMDTLSMYMAMQKN